MSIGGGDDIDLHPDISAHMIINRMGWTWEQYYNTPASKIGLMKQIWSLEYKMREVLKNKT